VLFPHPNPLPKEREHRKRKGKTKMQISPIQQNNTSFRAQMQLRGNLTLLKKEQTQTLKNIIDKLGSKTDIIDINLSENINKGFIPLAIFANNKLFQVFGEIKNNDVYAGVVNALEQTKEIFPSIATIISDCQKNISDKFLLEHIKKKINEFIYARESICCSGEQRFIDILLINAIHNDDSLYEEYTRRMQGKNFYFRTIDGDGYRTGNDFEDGLNVGINWHECSSFIVNEMLWKNESREKFAKLILKNLKNNETLEHFSIEQLEDYYNKLDEKFREYVKIDTRNIFVLKDHLLPDYIKDLAKNNRYLSTYMDKESKKERYTYFKDNKLIKAYELRELLYRGTMFRTSLFIQLLLNEPYKLPYKEQKLFLDKILQCTIRENTKEELAIIEQGDVGF